VRATLITSLALFIGFHDRLGPLALPIQTRRARAQTPSLHGNRSVGFLFGPRQPDAVWFLHRPWRTTVDATLQVLSADNLDFGP